MKKQTNSFEEYYISTYSKVVTSISFYTKSVEVAEDISANAFVKAFENFGSFDNNKASFFTWVVSIAKNAMIDYFRTNEFKNRFLNSDSYLNEEDNNILIPVSSEKTDSDLIRSEIKAELIGSIRKLKPMQRKVAVLRFLNQKEYVEIAEYMQIPLGSVKALVSRAKKELQTMLQY